MPGIYADLSRGTKLYAIWLPVGSVPVTIENRANDETNETFAKAGGTITLPTPQAKDVLTFAYWGCSIRLTDGNYTWSELKAGENLPIPEKAAEVRILACWSLDKQVTVNGKSYSFAANSVHEEGDGWSIWYNSQKAKLTLTLDGYKGSGIELPVQRNAELRGYAAHHHGMRLRPAQQSDGSGGCRCVCARCAEGLLCPRAARHADCRCGSQGTRRPDGHAGRHRQR